MVKLVSWTILGDFVSLIYSNCFSFLVLKSDFDRAFGTIVSSSYSDVYRYFAVQI